MPGDSRHARFVICLLAIFVTACFLEHQRWSDFRSDEDAFVASFPGTPTRADLTVNTSAGPIAVHQYSLTATDMSFAVAVTQVPKGRLEEVGQKGLLDGARNGAIANTQGTLLNELIIDVQGNPGREIKLSVAGGKSTIRAKLFLANGRLYQAVAVTATDAAYSSSVRRFLDSVLPTGTEAQEGTA